MEAFFGTWKLESNEGLGDLMVRLGAGVIARTTMNASKPIMIFAREKGPGDPEVGEVFSIKTRSGIKNIGISFRMGYTFDENTMDGRTVRTVFTMDGDTLKQEQSGTKKTSITYNVEGDLLKMVIKVEELTCFRTFRRVLQPHAATTTKSLEATQQESISSGSTPTPRDVKETNGKPAIRKNGATNRAAKAK
ncbi:unnamed protein product [Hymenolepis diminuta]|uniref:FABP domain-containing protein n=1 Tax=Hymenolepis diminuta TaxID=6216 RepID=A0A0R3SI88_HYMDI|nr:unnamed protein product [Hymenolepis diminuta]VUZ49634.1 unnamed protein product [Hymenolepis diminuta]